MVRCGFTLVELLVVIAIIAILTTIILPALARAKEKARGIYCMNNTKQLMVAWHTYTSDNAERIVEGYHNASPPPDGSAPWIRGWLTWNLSTDNTNYQFLIEEPYSKLARYYAKSASIFKCPSDTYLTAAQRAQGWPERVRSVAANIGIGAGNAETGPWDSLYKHITKPQEMIFPGPAETWVYLDEHPDSINDAAFFNPHQTSWVDVPATYHHGATGFAFGDGHSEIHKWRGSLATHPNARKVRFSPNGRTITDLPAGDPDIKWLSYRAGRVSETSY